MENEAAKNMKENLSDRVRRTRQSLDEIRAETQARARRAVRITNNYAHDHPWRMVLTGAALALTIGLLMRKNPRKIVVRKASDILPIVKIKRVNEHRGSRWEAVSAFMPIALFAAKTIMAARANDRIEPEPAAQI